VATRTAIWKKEEVNSAEQCTTQTGEVRRRDWMSDAEDTSRTRGESRIAKTTTKRMKTDAFYLPSTTQKRLGQSKERIAWRRIQQPWDFGGGITRGACGEG